MRKHIKSHKIINKYVFESDNGNSWNIIKNPSVKRGFLLIVFVESVKHFHDFVFLSDE
jgi:hypothetical protein